MHTIQISVRDKIATQTDGTVIINGNSDYSIEFDFDAEWADLNNKVGIFAYNDAAAHKWAYQTVLFSGNTCTVPILRDIHCVYVGVTAGNVRVTTPAKVPCRLSISDYADTEEPPSADVWGQILAKLDELQTEINEIKEGEVWEKICQVTTTENVSFVYQPFGGNYKKIRAIFAAESTTACQVWIYPNTKNVPGGRDIAYIFNAPYANAGNYTIVGEFSSSPYPAPDGSKDRYRGRCSVARERKPTSLHAGWGDSLFDNYVDDFYAHLGEGDLAQGIKSLYWTHSTGEIKAGAKMVVYGVKA
jgi:hypothetical protein|nr:MAG TPA: hypothetical protein [Bacteriophage sp.]